VVLYLTLFYFIFFFAVNIRSFLSLFFFLVIIFVLFNQGLMPTIDKWDFLISYVEELNAYVKKWKEKKNGQINFGTIFVVTI
jgi:hypothetical protein